jgi:hypothetical protein
MSNFFKSSETLTAEIKRYSDLQGDLGTTPNAYKDGKAYSSILKKDNNEITFATNLITSINDIRVNYETLCSQGKTPATCHKAISACENIIAALNAAKRKLETYSGGRNKINNTQNIRNIKSHRKNRLSKSQSRRHSRKLKSRKAKA